MAKPCGVKKSGRKEGIFLVNLPLVLRTHHKPTLKK